MNKLKELLDPLGKTRHLLNEYCVGMGGCANCLFYKKYKHDRQNHYCCWNVARSMEELECRIVDIMNEENKDEN